MASIYFFIYLFTAFACFSFSRVFSSGRAAVRLAQEGVPFAGLPAPWEQRGGCGCGTGAPGSRESRNCLLRHRADVTRSGAAAQE